MDVAGWWRWLTQIVFGAADFPPGLPIEWSNSSWALKMKFTGQVFCAPGVEANFIVSEAIVTPQRISIDWKEGEDKAHLDATSSDGVHFQGFYGYPTRDSDLEFELTLFKNKDEYLLFGTYCHHDTGDEGCWVFRLQTPEAKPHVTKTAIQPRQPSKAKSSAVKQKRPPAQPKRPSTPTVQKVKVPVSPESGPSKGGGQSGGNQATAPTKIPPLAASPPGSSYLDHLIEMTPDQFAQADRSKITADLHAAPVAAVFKVAHNAKAEALRSVAEKVFAQRYGTPVVPKSDSQGRPSRGEKALLRSASRAKR